jgi:hypothetical protein
MNNPAAAVTPRRSAPTGPLPAALNEWCRWIYTQAELAHRANPKTRDPDGNLADWRTFCGMYERRLIEAAITAGVFVP